MVAILTNQSPRDHVHLPNGCESRLHSFPFYEESTSTFVLWSWWSTFFGNCRRRWGGPDSADDIISKERNKAGTSTDLVYFEY